jgi:integrase
MRVRYQGGHLRCVKRKNGPPQWEFLWRENDLFGKSVRRNAVIGTVEQYPTEELAQATVNGLRMQINKTRNRQREQSILMTDLIDHYMKTELDPNTDWRSYATRTIYREFLTKWIKPHWGSTNIREVRTVAVESWLRQLKRKDSQDLANSTKAKIRNLMSVIFNHAIRNEWLEQGKNPITLVRQTAKRQVTPSVLETYEIQRLLCELEPPFRVMVLLDVTTGLRRGELFALQWSDVDFWNLTLDIKRSIFQGVVGNCKTEASRKPVPLSLEVAADLWLWRESTAYTRAEDWIFTSARVKGKQPRRPDTVMAKIIRPAAVRAGINKRIGWHTFRHTYSTLLIANGENIKVVQELMRHANSRCLLDVYTQARISAKRDAQQRIVQMILPDKGLTSEIKLQRNGPDEQLDDAD